MDVSWYEDWLRHAPLLGIGAVLLLLSFAAALAGYALQRFHARADAAKKAEADSQEGFVVSAVAGLLALLTGFTFSLAVDRYDTRRRLVLEEANAIGTTYLRAQLLTEPHRARISDLLVRYTDNRVVLGKDKPGPDARQRLAVNDALVVDLWTATAASWDSIKGYDFSSAFIDSMNTLIDLDASRKMARAAQVPTVVFTVLFIYLIMTAGVMGYVMNGPRGRITAVFLLALLTLSQMLILDIDRPTGGRIVESQLPMERLRDFLHAQPPSTFDHWKAPAAAAAPAKP